MQCEVCGIEIPAERLEAVPDTRRCRDHSNVVKRVGFMDYSHKTAPSLVLLDPADSESVRLAKRAFNRSR